MGLTTVALSARTHTKEEANRCSKGSPLPLSPGKEEVSMDKGPSRGAIQTTHETTPAKTPDKGAKASRLPTTASPLSRITNTTRTSLFSLRPTDSV